MVAQFPAAASVVIPNVSNSTVPVPAQPNLPSTRWFAGAVDQYVASQTGWLFHVVDGLIAPVYASFTEDPPPPQVHAHFWVMMNEARRTC